MDSNQRYLSPYCLARSQSRPYAPNWDIETLTPEARANASQNVSRIRRGTDSIAWSPAVIGRRRAPASISSKRGPTLRAKRSPASVSETLRVVRVRSLTPSRIVGQPECDHTPEERCVPPFPKSADMNGGAVTTSHFRAARTPARGCAPSVATRRSPCCDRSGR